MSEDKKEPLDAQAEIDRVRDEIQATPAPGEDPDSKRRLAKHLVAAGVDLPKGLSTDPITDEEREAHGANPVTDDDKKTAAEKRAAAGTSHSAAPQGRSSTPPGKAKAAEEK